MLLFFRRYRLPIIVANFLLFFFFLQAIRQYNSPESSEDNEGSSVSSKVKLTTELRMLRLAFLKWKACFLKEVDEELLSMDDIDPADPRYTYLEYIIKRAQKKAAKLEEDDDRFEKIWSNLEAYSRNCRMKTDLWHVEPETIPGTGLYYFPPIVPNTPTTFVRIGIGANITIEKYFKSVMSSPPEFYGADPNFTENSELYESLGTFFPFAVGNKTSREKTMTKTSSGRSRSQIVSHIGIYPFFKKFVQRNLIDYLIFEGDGGEYDMMSHLAKNGTLEEGGITVCQINIEYHRPKNQDDPRRETFIKHIMQFIRDRKYAILKVTNFGNLRVFWVNTSSMECAQRFVERYFRNDIDSS